MKNGIELIAAEREAQSVREGWTPDHDDTHREGELALAAACYALPAVGRLDYVTWNHGLATRGGTLLQRLWPWDWRWWKPTHADRIRELAKAGALCAAEIDRLQRLAAKKP